MSDQQQPIKAVRATIKLGEIEFEGYQLPDGTYKVTAQTFKETLGALIGNSTGKRHLKPLLEASPSIVEHVKIESYNKPVVMFGIDTFTEVVGAYARLGNQKAIAMLIACANETMERRFDNAFGVAKTEEERQTKFTYIFDKVTRDERVAPYIRLRTIAFDFGGTELCVRLCKMVNRAVFNVENFDSDRDRMSPQQQSAICYLEKTILRGWMESDHTAKGLVKAYDVAIGDFVSVHGDQFHQEQPKRRVYKTAIAQAKQLQAEQDNLRKEAALERAFSLQYR
jgi:hypothetical protein